MAEGITDVLAAAPAATVLAAGGVLFLSLAIQNERWWPADSKAGLHTRGERLLCGAFGLAFVVPIFVLLFYSVADHRGGAEKDDAALRGRVSNLEKGSKGVAQLQERVALLEEGPATVSRLAGLNTEIRSLRAATMGGDASGRNCAQVNEGPSTGVVPKGNAGWVEKASSPCDQMKNDAWTIEIQGDLLPFAGELLKRLDEVKIPYLIGTPQGRFNKNSGIPAGVGLVFDADAPATLICRVHEWYVASTGSALEFATTQDTVLAFSSPPANVSSFGIRLGVFFPDIFQGQGTTVDERRITPDQWQHLCAKPDQQLFDRDFKTWAVKFKPSPTPHSPNHESGVIADER